MVINLNVGKKWVTLFKKYSLRGKCPNTELFLVCIFLFLVCIFLYSD